MTKTDLKELARVHDLQSISVTFFPDSGRYSANVQWMEHGERRCEFADLHMDTPDEAISSAIAAKMKVSYNQEDEKARLIAELRQKLALLTGEDA